MLKKKKGKAKKYKKALKAETWSDTECEESDENYVNICVMAKSELDSNSNSKIEVIIKKKVLNGIWIVAVQGI